MQNQTITQSALKDALHYDQHTGIFTWKKRLNSRGPNSEGKRAGHVNKSGHRYIGVGDRDYTAQQLAWLYVYGEFPSHRIAHKNGDHDDCRLENLVAVTFNGRPKGAFDFSTPEGRKEYGQTHRRENFDLYRAKDLQKTFGITLEQYNKMHNAQSGVCDICKKPETATRNGKIKWLAVDHHHETGKVRGLLCAHCNTAIGKFEENIDVMESAIAYLKKHATPTVTKDEPNG